MIVRYPGSSLFFGSPNTGCICLAAAQDSSYDVLKATAPTEPAFFEDLDGGGAIASSKVEVVPSLLHSSNVRRRAETSRIVLKNDGEDERFVGPPYLAREDDEAATPFWIDSPFGQVVAPSQKNVGMNHHWNLPSPYRRADKNTTFGYWNSDVITSNSGIMYTIPHTADQNDDGIVLPTTSNVVANQETPSFLKTSPKVSKALLPPSKSNHGEKRMVSDRKPRDNNKDDEDDEDAEQQLNIIYKSGIPTLRSSAHRVKFSVKGRKQDPKPRDSSGKETKTTWLPDPLLKEDVLTYDTHEYDLQAAVVSLLKHHCDPDIVGTFVAPTTTQPQSQPHHDGRRRAVAARLEDFRVPVKSTWRSVNDGCCESAQKYLSDAVSSNDAFLETFDRFVQDVILPYLKQRLVDCNNDDDATTRTEEPSGTGTPREEKITFYYQYPPTLRLQPGPGWAKVKPHNDAVYGHQNGELNFWVPLTDRERNGVDLWCETAFQADDYHPVPASVGEAIAFHGSSCRHYVNPNETENTRVSLDFRIGVQKYFDPFWTMRGTTDNHGRREITI
jgi:hypothetical protein